MEEGIRKKIERLKVKAELFLKNNQRAFINTLEDNYYFCNILVIGDLFLEVYSFAGKRTGERDKIIWTDIIDIKEYIEKEVRE